MIGLSDSTRKVVHGGYSVKNLVICILPPQHIQTVRVRQGQSGDNDGSESGNDSSRLATELANTGIFYPVVKKPSVDISSYSLIAARNLASYKRTLPEHPLFNHKVINVDAMSGYRVTGMRRETLLGRLRASFNRWHSAISSVERQNIVVDGGTTGTAAKRVRVDELNQPVEDPNAVAFQRAKAELQDTHSGWYIAIAEGKVLGVNPHRDTLLEQVLKITNPETRILLQQIGPVTKIKFHRPQRIRT